MKKFFQNLYNSIDFFFRQNICIKRKFEGVNEDKTELFRELSPEKALLAEEKEKLLFNKYSLNYLKSNSTCRNYLENLAVIELLEYCFSEKTFTDKEVKVLDIGSKNWFYASGEWAFFNHNSNNQGFYLDGVELDGYRVYSDFHTRCDYAQFYIKNLQNTRYMVKNILKHNEKYDFIIWFFPFVTEFPLLEWGLPLSEFQPEKLLKHAYSLLNPNGEMLIINQDENEHQIQQNLLSKLNIKYKTKPEFFNSFIEFERKRCVTIVEKNEFY